MIHLFFVLLLELWPAVRTYARAQPDVTPGYADVVVDAAYRHQTEQVSAALIVVLAWHESRFDPKAGPACGVMQVYPRDIERPASDCAVWAKDVDAGVRAGVVEIETMLRDARVRGDLRRALLYRACGNVAFKAGCAAPKIAWVNAILHHVHAVTKMHLVDKRRTQS